MFKGLLFKISITLLVLGAFSLSDGVLKVNSAAAAEITPIVNPDVICLRPGGMIAIAQNPPRVWQGDPDVNEALELEVTKFETTMTAWMIEARLDMWGQAETFIFELSLGDMQLKMGIPLEPGGEMTWVDFFCRRQNTI